MLKKFFNRFKKKSEESKVLEIKENVINKDEKNFIKESIESYANITNIADQVEYEKNKLYKLQSKNKIFEAYYNVQENDWISAKNNVNLANSYLEKIENLKNRVKVSLKNLSNSVDQNDETVFYIKYEDLINEINYIDV